MCDVVRVLTSLFSSLQVKHNLHAKESGSKGLEVASILFRFRKNCFSSEPLDSTLYSSLTSSSTENTYLTCPRELRLTCPRELRSGNTILFYFS